MDTRWQEHSTEPERMRGLSSASSVLVNNFVCIRERSVELLSGGELA